MRFRNVLKRTACVLLLTSPFALNAQRQANPVISPEILSDNSVVFRLYAPQADTVKLGGTMNADYSELEMKKNEEGVFELKIGPLAPDMYVYTFKVDGVTTLDPANNIVVRDGSYIESRLMIPGGLTDLYDETGFKYTYRESEGGHSWNNWRLYLSEFAPMLFR